MQEGRRSSIGRWRRRPAARFAIAAVAVAAFLAGATPAARGQCVPPVVACPAPPPQSPSASTGPPQARIIAVQDVRDTSATFVAEIDPGGLSTNYEWGYEYSTGYGTYLAPQDEYTAPGSSSWVRIQTRVRLTPGSRYDSLKLTVSNADGSAQATWGPGFTTPEHPRLRLGLRRNWLTFGVPFPVRVRVFGTYNSIQAVKFYVARSPYRRWREADGDPMRSYDRNSVAAQPCAHPPNDQCMGLDRNFKLRAVLGPGVSRTRLIYVLPYLALTSTRENGGNSPWLDVTYSAAIHQMRRYPDPLAYFYVSRSRKGAYTRVGAARFRVAVRPSVYGTQLHATVRIYSAAAAYIRACFKHRLVTDMGLPFTDARCGRPSLRL